LTSGAPAVRSDDEGRDVTFDEFAHTQLPPLLRFARVLCADRGLAEDVVQEVLVRAHARWATIEALDRPDAYVRRMIVNEFLSWRRKWGRISPRADIVLLEDVPDHAEAHADRDQLLAELAQLPRRQRAVLVLRYYGGLSDAEIAVELDCGVSTVRAHASRALTRLRVELHPAAQLPAAQPSAAELPAAQPREA
jgi:RNA polymerase sigma-70 factor (sigma-E family)